MWSGQGPASCLNCPANLILEFQSVGNESPIALPCQGLGWGTGWASASCLIRLSWSSLETYPCQGSNQAQIHQDWQHQAEAFVVIPMYSQCVEPMPVPTHTLSTSLTSTSLP